MGMSNGQNETAVDCVLGGCSGKFTAWLELPWAQSQSLPLWFPNFAEHFTLFQNFFFIFPND